MSAVATTVTAGATVSSHAGTPLSNMRALLKREFWEHRGAMWSAQVWTTGILLVLLVGSLLIGEAFRMKLIGDVDMSGLSDLALNKIGPAEMAKYREGLGIGLWGLGMLNYVVLYFVVLFYCIGALYDERKDRSILFWKSLPATDTQTVLSKLITAVLVAPVLATVAVFALQIGFLLLLGLYVALHGINPLPFMWQPGVIGTVWAQMVVAIPVHMLWAIPGIAWLLLASSWAKRVPFVWAILVPILAATFLNMIEVASRLSLSRSWFWEHVVGRIFSSPGAMSLRPWRWGDNRFGDTDNPFARVVGWDSMQTTLTSPETWIGLVIGAALIAAAIWLRRYRDDS